MENPKIDVIKARITFMDEIPAWWYFNRENDENNVVIFHRKNGKRSIHDYIIKRMVMSMVSMEDKETIERCTMIWGDTPINGDISIVEITKHISVFDESLNITTKTEQFGSGAVVEFDMLSTTDWITKVISELSGNNHSIWGYEYKFEATDIIDLKRR